MTAKPKVDDGSQDARKPARYDISVSLWVRLLESHNLMLAELRRRFVPDKGAASLPRFDLLANLIRQDGQTLASLSRRMLVDRAERDALVERRADPQDRRLSRVFLTKKGRALIVSLLPRHAALVADLLEGLDAKERRELRRLLGKLRGSFTEQAEAAE